MGKAEENKLAKRNQLLETAFRLFTTQGISKTSISDIANAAGVGKGTFYLYFKDKQDIEARLISRRAGQLLHHAVEHVEQNRDVTELEDKIVALVNDIVDQLSHDPILLKFIYKNLSWGIFRNALEHSYSEEDREYRVTLDEIFKNEKDQWIEPELMLYTIIELTSSTCYNVILWNDPVDMDTYREFLDRDILSIIRNHRRVTEECPAPDVPAET